MKKTILCLSLLSILILPLYSCQDTPQEKEKNEDFDTRTKMDNAPTIYDNVDSSVWDSTMQTAPKY